MKIVYVKKKLINYLVEQCTSIADIDSYKKESSETNVYFIYYIFDFVCFIRCRINILFLKI